MSRCCATIGAAGWPHASTPAIAMYGRGQGVPTDYVKAYAWLSLAAAQGNKKATRSRGIVEKRMTPQQIAQAQAIARIKWQSSN